MDGVDITNDGGSLWHEVAGDGGVLVQDSPYDTHGREQPQALFDAVLEMNEPLHVLTECSQVWGKVISNLKWLDVSWAHLVMSSPSSFSLKIASTSCRHFSWCSG